jgi:hypothetical protein
MIRKGRGWSHSLHLFISSSVSRSHQYFKEFIDREFYRTDVYEQVIFKLHIFFSKTVGTIIYALCTLWMAIS